MQSPPQKHPKTQKNDHLGCNQNKNASQILLNIQFGMQSSPQKHPKQSVFTILGFFTEEASSQSGQLKPFWDFLPKKQHPNQVN